MSILLSIFLGFIQGVAEFLPISSSGHLSVFQNLLKLEYSEAEHLFFDVLLHFGTLCAVVFYYRKDLKRMCTEAVGFISGRGVGTEEGGRMTPGVRTIFFVIVGTLPLLLLLPFYDKVEELYYNTTFIGFAFLVTGGLLFISDKLTAGKKSEKTFTIVDALIIGVGQMIAVIPGISRSGTTITVALARGLERDFAVKFSFLLSIPAVLGSFLLSLVKAFKAGIEWSSVPAYLIGMVVAAVVGYFAIKLMRFLVNKAGLGKFAYYCWAAGIVTLILSIVL